MSKFVIECPSCGRYAEASTGFFAKKKIDCACGYVINFISALTYLNDEWRDKRNQLTHSLFNKDPDTVIAELKSLIEKGYIAVRVFDNAVAQLKKEKIRNRFKI